MTRVSRPKNGYPLAVNVNSPTKINLRRRIYRFAIVMSVGCLLTQTFTSTGLANSDLPATILEGVPAKVADRNGLRGEHRDAYLRLLDAVRDIPIEELQRQAADNLEKRRREQSPEGGRFAFSQFADIVKNPESWQGKAVRIIGHANRIVKYSVSDNDAQQDQVFESWVVTADSQQYPTVIVAHDVPEGTPIGEQEVVGVDATGILFQVFTYNARDGRIRYGPLIIADRWTLPVPPAASDREWLLVGLALAFAISISWQLVKASKRRPRRRSVASHGLEISGDPADSEPESA